MTHIYVCKCNFNTSRNLWQTDQPTDGFAGWKGSYTSNNHYVQKKWCFLTIPPSPILQYLMNAPYMYIQASSVRKDVCSSSLNSVYRVFIKYCVFFSRIFESLPPLPRQHSAAFGCTKIQQPIGVTVHSHCVESFEGLLKRCRRWRGCSELWKNTIFPEHPVLLIS